MFKYPKSANSLEKDVAAAAAASSTSIGQGIFFKFSILFILWKIDNKNTNKKMSMAGSNNKIKQRPLKT
jgi:hypothetical protein